MLVCWCPSASKLTRTTVKMRQSFVAALVLCTAAAFAPQQHSTRGAIKLFSSVKPSAGISFYDGLYEPDVPDVKLTRCRRSVLQNVTTPSTCNVVTTPSPRRSKDGENGVATFNFAKPSFFNCERE